MNQNAGCESSRIVLIVNRQPDRFLRRIGPIDAMPPVRRDVDEVAGIQFHDNVLESDPGGALEHQHPFVPVLVIPKIFGRRVSLGYDPFNANICRAEERLDKLVGQPLGQIAEDVRGVAHFLSGRFSN